MKILRNIFRGLTVYSLFAGAVFAQEVNLQAVEWAASSSATLPSLSEGYNGYAVSGDLGSVYNYFYKGSSSAEDAKDLYVDFQNLTSSSDARIYLGENGATGAASYYGNLTAVISGDFALQRYTAGAFARSNTYVGNVSTTINGNVNFSDTLTLGGGYSETAGVTLYQESTSLTLNNGTYVSNIAAAGFVKGGANLSVKNSSSLVINKATINPGGDWFVAGGALSYGSGTATIQGGSSLYLGAGAHINGGDLFGGSFGYGSNTSVTGGTSITIDGATIATSGSQIFGGSNSSGVVQGVVSTVDSSKVVVKSGTISSWIFGGSLSQSNGATVVTGDSSVEILGGDISGQVFGGSYGWDADSPTFEATVKGNTSVKISGGTITGYVFGGSRTDSDQYRGGSNANIEGSSSVEISGSALVNGDVFGGSVVYIAGTGSDASANIAGATNIVVSGGTVTGNILAGSYVQNELSDKKAQASVSSANITISKGEIGGDIYAGGYGEGSVIEGASTVKFIGNSSDIKFSGTVYGSGVNSALVQGDTQVAFGDAENSFSGSFAGGIESFDKLIIANENTNVTFEKAFNVEVLSVDSGAQATIADASSFGELNIAFLDGDFGEGSVFAFDLGAIFGDSESLVLSALEGESKLTLTNSDGETFLANYANESFEVLQAVPEPSTFAAILGSLALAFAAYRRRK